MTSVLERSVGRGRAWAGAGRGLRVVEPGSRERGARAGVTVSLQEMGEVAAPSVRGSGAVGPNTARASEARAL